MISDSLVMGSLVMSSDSLKRTDEAGRGCEQKPLSNEMLVNGGCPVKISAAV